MVRLKLPHWINCIYITGVLGLSWIVMPEARSIPMRANHSSLKASSSLSVTPRSYPKDWCLVTEGVPMMAGGNCGGTLISKFELPPKDDIQSFFTPLKGSIPPAFEAIARCSSLQNTVVRSDVDLPFPIEPKSASVKPLCVELP